MLTERKNPLFFIIAQQKRFCNDAAGEKNKFNKDVTECYFNLHILDFCLNLG